MLLAVAVIAAAVVVLEAAAVVAAAVVAAVAMLLSSSSSFMASTFCNLLYQQVVNPALRKEEVGGRIPGDGNDLCPTRLIFQKQVVLVRLRTEHNRLKSDMHGKLKLASSPTCPCGQEDQTTEHVL